MTLAQPATDRMNGCFSAYRVLAPTAEPMSRVAAAVVQPKVPVGAVPRQETMAAVCQLVLAGSYVRPSEQHGKTCQCVGCTWEESPRLYSRPRPPLSTTRRARTIPRRALASPFGEGSLHRWRQPVRKSCMVGTSDHTSRVRDFQKEGLHRRRDFPKECLCLRTSDCQSAISDLFNSFLEL